MHESNETTSASGIRSTAIAVVGTLGGGLVGLFCASVGTLPRSAPLTELPRVLGSAFHGLIAYYGLIFGGVLGLCLSVLAVSLRKKVNVVRCIVLTTLGMVPIVVMLVRHPSLLRGPWMGIAILIVWTLALFYLLVFVELRLRKRIGA